VPERHRLTSLSQFEAVSVLTVMTVYSGSAMVAEGAPRAGIGIMLQPVMPGGQASPALPRRRPTSPGAATAGGA